MRDQVTLDDKYVAERGNALMSGVQALVRLTLEQRRVDRERGLDTQVFVSGYQGSPLGGLDTELTRALAARPGRCRLPCRGERGTGGNRGRGSPPDTIDDVVSLGDLPDLVRGYEDIKLPVVERFRDRAADLSASLTAPSAATHRTTEEFAHDHHRSPTA